ncbi:MAG: permease, partial [Candidatus Eremiobacteraeota bacterium]|nr:permease [Candidatus Eremiobacteraeota bacterium]
MNAIASGLLASLQLFWDSLFGLIFGFLISAIVQVVLTPATMERYLGPNLRGVLSGTGFGIIASACSYGAAAAARGFYQRGADIRAVFAFLISSTNMNVAILILFWSLLGWKFAFAEFVGGIIIIAVVVTGFSVLFGGEQPRAVLAATDDDDHHCCHDAPASVGGGTWGAIAETMKSDLGMLRTELLIGYLVAGFATAIVP